CPDALGVDAGGDAGREAGIQLLHGSVCHGQVDLVISLPERDAITVVIHDLLGRRVRVVARGRFPSGRSALAWDGSDEAGGRAPTVICFVPLGRGGSRTSVLVVFLRGVATLGGSTGRSRDGTTVGSGGIRVQRWPWQHWHASPARPFMLSMPGRRESPHY